VCRTEFTVTMKLPEADTSPQLALGMAQADLGVGNRLTLLDDQLLANLRNVQLRNGLAPSEQLNSGDFTVEMETGTGKTYVYLRTIFELNQRYGFTKFVIVVPSVAMKEGVYKSLQITQEHFRGLYAGVPVDFFLYDSGKLGQALQDMHPLCTLRYSATHANKHHMVYRLNALDAYERKLVKQMEGWDNLNVFQICTLRDMGTERERRQTIGRGLRLCVNQHGERVRGWQIGLSVRRLQGAVGSHKAPNHLPGAV
jgi:restriction endonuclease